MVGVTFDDKHSYDDFGMILSSKEIGMPSVKENKVSVNGIDGAIDLSESINGSVNYNNRKLSFTFSVINRRGLWLDILSSVSAYVHGKSMKIILDDDKDFFYQGRVSVNKFKSNISYAEIVIDVDAKPFKYRKELSTNLWIWDSFNFRTGLAQTTSYIVTGTLDAVITNTQAGTCPEFVSTAQMEILFDGETYIMQSGMKKFYDIILTEGKNNIIFKGNGKVDVVFRMGEL